ncbi:hypothetical protein [uncultured Rothia sp.]|uniref:hypothetical protein n=1 Tax=uncultured Rothia sp. TaxID=316088 RepID=UPI003216E425
MNKILLASAEAEHTEQLMLLGIPTFWFGIIAAILFLLLFTITISFSGRGIVRLDHAGDQMGHDESQAIADYQAKHGH